MDTTTAQQMIGRAVQVKGDASFFGVLEYVTLDGWAGIRGPGRRLDEVQVSRLELDPT